MSNRKRQSASNYRPFAIELFDSTPGVLESGGTQVTVPDSAKIYVNDGSALLIDGADCTITDNGNGTIGIEYRPTTAEVATAARKQLSVQFFVKWPDAGGKSVEEWLEIDRIQLLPNLA